MCSGVLIKLVRVHTSLSRVLAFTTGDERGDLLFVLQRGSAVLPLGLHDLSPATTSHSVRRQRR